MAEIIVPNEKLRELRRKLSQAKTVAERTRIAEEITALESTLMSEPSGAATIEEARGGISPAVATPESFKGKTILSPSMTEGIYRATKYDPVTGAATNLSQTDTGVTQFGAQASDKKLVYYDAQGKPISSSALAQTQEGKNMAAAGYDIGYGAGKIGPGAADYATGYKAPGTTDYNVMMGLDPLTGQPVEEVIAGRAKYTDPRSGRVVTTDTSGKLVFADGTPYTASSTQATIAETEKKEKIENAIALLTMRFSQYGLQSLIPKIKELAISGATEATITLQLQESEEYKTRFKANEDRIKKGLRVLDPGTYLGLEDRYRQIIRAYGLKQFDNDSYVTQFISNDVSPEELSSRVVNAVQRVQNADPAVSAMLRQYYNIGVTDMVAYVLDPSNQLPKIERQISAAEIGVAAGRQGFTAGVNVAEQLAAQGVTEAEARRGYSTIADILPQATKLSQIYTGVLDQYGQAEAEQEVFNSLASAQRKRRALAEREIASFSGASGLSKTALDRQTGGTY